MTVTVKPVRRRKATLMDRLYLPAIAKGLIERSRRVRTVQEAPLASAQPGQPLLVVVVLRCVFGLLLWTSSLLYVGEAVPRRQLQVRP